MTVFYIDPQRLQKGAWHGQEKAGHKYIKRERQADGTYRYWYPEEDEREDKPATSKRKHEEHDYRPPTLRYSDEACLDRLMSLGDWLAGIQDGLTRDDTGFNNYDAKSWGFVSAGVRADDPASMFRIRKLLAKYKRQITGNVGLDEFYKLGLQDAITAAGEHGGPVMMAGWGGDGRLVFSVAGYIGKGEPFSKYLALNREFGVRFARDRQGKGYNYITAEDAEKFDFEGYAKRLLEEVNIKLDEIPERPVQAAPADSSPQGTEATVQPESAGNKMTTDDVINDIIDKQARNTVAMKVLTQGEDKGKLAIWSTYSTDFNAIMGNKSTDPRAITGIVEARKDMGWARLTNNPRLADEILAKIRKHMPDFTVVIDPNVDEWKAAHEAKTADNEKPIPELQAKLNPEIKPFPFQNAAVRFFQANDGNGLLGDEMGLGKTLEALAYAAATGKRTIVVCPKVVRKNWLLEAKRFFPGHFDDVKELVSADLKREGMPDLSKVKIATINYEILDKFLPAIKAAGFDLLIVDESHRMKNPKAKLTKRIQEIAKGVTHKILLSGTALKNKREELFTQLELVRPGFVTLGELKGGMIGPLYHKLAEIYLARKKRDVVADMPPKLKQAVVLEVPDAPGVKPKDEDEAYADGGWMEDAELTEDERREMGGGGSDLAEVTRLKHGLAKAKAPVTAEFVKELLESSDSNVLVFTDSVPAAEILKEKLGAVAALHTGKQSTDAQEAARAHFDPLRRKEGDPVRVLVSTTVKGIGFNAQTADKVVFNDLPWTPADKDQAEDRAYRIGTKSTVNVYDIHAEGSAFDTATAQLLLKKAVLYHKLLDGTKLSAAETAWANTKITPAEILAAMRGEKVGPGVAEVEAPPIKTSTGMTVIPPKPEDAPKAKPAPKPAPEKTPEEKASEDEWAKIRGQYAQEEADRKAKDARDATLRETFRRESIKLTNPQAAKALEAVPEKIRGLMTALHSVEGSLTSNDEARKVISPAAARSLRDWFFKNRKDPQVTTHERTYVFKSPAGTFALQHHWKGQEAEWEISYSSLGSQVTDALPKEQQDALDKMHEDYKAATEAPLRPKFVIPAAKPIEDTKPKGGEPEESAHAHTGAGATTKEDKLETKVETAGQPQQMLLFKSLRDDAFYLGESAFDLCMSYADRLVDIGEFEDAIDLIKAAVHKYLRRIPTGKPRPKWRYIYNITSKHHDAQVKEGEKVALHHDGQSGHYEVETIHPNGYVTVRHDETGQRMSLKQDHLHEMFAEEHLPAIEAAHQRLQRTVEAAKLHGTEKQQSAAKEALRGHEARFAIKTPERIATQKAQGLSVLTRAAPTVENHLASAEAHIHAAGFGGEHAQLHLEMAKLHHEAAKLRGAKAQTKEALTTPGVNFMVPGKTEAEKAAAPVLTLPKGKWGGKREAKGAFFGDKRAAYRNLVSDEERGDFVVADTAYWKWKDGRGPKPEPWKGGELDAVNQALGLETKRKGFKVIDPRVTSLAEGWDRLVGLAKRWDADKVMAAIEVLRQVPGLSKMQLPPEAEAAHDARMAAELDEEQRKDQEGAYEEARLDDAVEKFSEADLAFDPEELGGYVDELTEPDTSFDFGFNVKPEDEDPKESYKAKGPKAPTFKAWFGDWEKNPAQASKVVKADGSPAEQHNMAPMVVYHGTAVGGFSTFDPDKVSRESIFGPGFYFTEDKGIATEYTEKDAEEGKAWDRCHGFRNMGTGGTNKPLDTIPADLAEKIISRIPGYGAKEKLEGETYNPNSTPFIAAALKRALGPDGVSLTKFLQEYRNPSGPLVDYHGDLQDKPWQTGRSGPGFGLAEFSELLQKHSNGRIVLQPEVHPPKVFEVFLNVRNPIDMDAPISREQFTTMAKQMAWMDVRRKAEALVKREFEKPYMPKDQEPDDYDKRKLAEYEDGLKRKARAEKLLEKWPTGAEQTPEKYVEMAVAIEDHPDPVGAALKHKRMAEGALGGHYLDDVMREPEWMQVTGQDRDYTHPLDYDQFLKLKEIRRQDRALDKDDQGNIKRDKQGKPLRTDKPMHGILHLSEGAQLTWGDVHWLHSNMHSDRSAKERFTQWAQDQGHDGISHTGGWNIGTKAHKVWIAFNPNQIKATENEGTFDPTTPDIHKSMKYQPNIFVLREDRLEKAWGSERPGHKYISRRAKPGGGWEYQYAEEAKPTKPAFHMQVPVLGAMGTISAETMDEKIADLVRLPHDVLVAMDKRLDGYEKRLGHAAPPGLHLWQHAVKTALGKAPPKMVAAVATKTEPKPAGKPKQLGFDFTAAAAITPNPEAQAKDDKALSTPPQGPDPEPVVVTTEPAPTPKGPNLMESVNYFQGMPPSDAAAKLQALSDADFNILHEQIDEGAFEMAAAAGHMPPHLKAWQQAFAQAKKTRETKPGEKATPTPKAKAKPKTKREPKAKAGPESKLVQTGDHIWGSRYDLAQIGRITSSEQLNGMNFSDAAFLVTKANLVPVHDLTTLAGVGQTPGAAHMSLAILASITSKPKDSDKSRRQYVEACHEVVESVLNCKTVHDIDEMLSTFRYKNRDTHTVVATLPDNLRGYDEANDWAGKELKRLQEENPDKEYGTSGYGSRIVEIHRAAYSTLGDAFQRMTAHRGKVYMDAYREARRADSAENGWEYLRTRGAEKATEKAAKKTKPRKAGAEEEASNNWRQRDVPEEVERVGGKKVRDADPARIKRTFKLREVDYGQRGYMTEVDREYHTQRLEEALTDFAEILDVDPDVISLNGRLGIALGARGRGHAAAHYETGRHVINITKFNGGGSVAHEWAHAMDNIMGTVHLGNKEGKGSGIYLSEKREHSQLPADVKAAIQDVWKAITKAPNPEQAREKHKAAVRAALGEANRLVRENNEAVSTIRTLKEKPTAEELPKKKASLERKIQGYKESLQKITEASKMYRLTATDRKQKESLEYWIGRVQKQLAHLGDPDTLRSPADNDRIADLEAKVEELRPEINRARALHNNLRKVDPERSEFYMAARLKGEYWYRTVELFARAFESHIEDKLVSKGMRSTYLVSGTRSRQDGAYPQGEERENMNRAMAKLVDVLSKGGHLRKALAWLEQQPLQRFTIRGGLA